MPQADQALDDHVSLFSRSIIPVLMIFAVSMLLKEARKGLFACYSVCETMKDTKEG